LIRVLICLWKILWQSAWWRLRVGSPSPGRRSRSWRTTRSHRPLGAGRGYDSEHRILLPRAAGSAVGGHRDFGFLAQCGHEDGSRLRHIVAPDQKAETSKGFSMSPHVLFTELMGFFLGKTLADRFAGAPAPVCGCAVCEGGVGAG
jgi:hypothetical protein